MKQKLLKIQGVASGSWSVVIKGKGCTDESCDMIYLTSTQERKPRPERKRYKSHYNEFWTRYPYALPRFLPIWIQNKTRIQSTKPNKIHNQQCIHVISFTWATRRGEWTIYMIFHKERVGTSLFILILSPVSVLNFNFIVVCITSLLLTRYYTCVVLIFLNLSTCGLLFPVVSCCYWILWWRIYNTVLFYFMVWYLCDFLKVKTGFFKLLLV